MNKKTSKKKELSQSFKILAKFQLLYWHLSFILYNFVFKKPYFFKFNLSNMENAANFFNLIPLLNI